MRILVFTTLYPNAETPAHGVFVENRLRAFLKRHDADVKVIAPVPWFPSRNETFGAYARFARVAERERRYEIDVYHPRYLIPPKTAMHVAPASLARTFLDAAQTLIDGGWNFNLIDAHYFYPDGAAAAEVAGRLKKPLVITARGTDINLIPRYAGPRKKILNAARRADRVVTVASALKEELVRLGAPGGKISVLRNGVDLKLFRPLDRAAIRKEMDLAGPVIASVGHLIDRKGHDLVIDAIKDIPDATLLIAGDGEKRAALEARAASAGIGGRMRFLGAVPHEDLPWIYNAADVLALASSREGWPNVLLEAMACGTPCVATPVWGSGEVICAPEAGKLALDRSAGAVAMSLKDILAAPPDRVVTRSYAERFSWDATADGMAAIFSDLVEKSAARAALKTAPAPLKRERKPKLIVTVDTEERFDWNGFDDMSFACCDPADIDRFQETCAEAEIEPLYLLTYPLLKDKQTAAYFRGLREAGLAECGLHLHQWATPPGDFPGEYFSFQKNLPRAAHLEKLQTLAAAFEEEFGERALSHRAGRYGVAPEDYELLARIGVEYDFSPSAGFDFSSLGGADFSGLSNAPFIANGGPKNGDWRIHVTPLCGARAINRTSLFLKQRRKQSAFSAARRKPPPMTTPMRLSPEGASLNDLKGLTRRLVADDTPVLTFTLHSTSLTEGANPYARSKGDADRMLAISRDYFAWFSGELGGEFLSFDDLRAVYESAA